MKTAKKQSERVRKKKVLPSLVSLSTHRSIRQTKQKKKNKKHTQKPLVNDVYIVYMSPSLPFSMSNSSNYYLKKEEYKIKTEKDVT